MRVGIVLNYIRHDSTYAALKSAETIRNLGYSVSFYDKAHKSSKANLHNYWDDFILSSKEIPFDDWVKECSVIVWFCYPTPKEVKYLKKEGKPSICLLTWDSVDSDIIEAVKNLDVLLCPSKAQKTYFENQWHLNSTDYLPLNCNVPFFDNEYSSKEGLRIVIACPGYQIKRIDSTKLFEVLHEAAQLIPNLHLEFLHSSKVASQIKVNFTKYEKSFDNGSSLYGVDDPTGWSEGPLAYALCDAVLWPVQIESYGYVALEALSMGTPVIAYNFPPMSEIITDQKNGFLIPCETKDTDLGVKYPIHNSKGIIDVIGRLASDPSLISKTKALAHKGLDNRIQVNRLVWQTTIDGLVGKDKSDGV